MIKHEVKLHWETGERPALDLRDDAGREIVRVTFRAHPADDGGGEVLRWPSYFPSSLTLGHNVRMEKDHWVVRPTRYFRFFDTATDEQLAEVALTIVDPDDESNYHDPPDSTNDPVDDPPQVDDFSCKKWGSYWKINFKVEPRGGVKYIVYAIRDSNGERNAYVSHEEFAQCGNPIVEWVVQNPHGGLVPTKYRTPERVALAAAREIWIQYAGGTSGFSGPHAGIDRENLSPPTKFMLEESAD